MTPEHAITVALAARNCGKSEDVLPMLQQVASRHPQNFSVWQTLGVLNRALGRSTAAIDAFRAAQKIAPNEVKAAYGVAQASLEAGRPAVALFEHACKFAPSDGSLILGLTAARLAAGNASEAIAALDNIVAKNPMWLDGHQAIANLRWQTGDRSNFTASYEHALTSNPAATILWGQMAHVQVQVEEYAQADATLRRAEKAVELDQSLLLLDAICASELGHAAKADGLFALLGTGPEPAIAERHIRHLLRTGRTAAALDRAYPLLKGPHANRIWPYVSIGWRLAGDTRAVWLDNPSQFVAVHDIGIDHLLPRLSQILTSLHNMPMSPLGQSVVGGSQTDGPLFSREEPEMMELRQRLIEAVGRYIAGLGAPDPRHPLLRHVRKTFGFEGSWSVKLSAGGRHESHIHPLGWISSAFYISVPSPAAIGAPPAGYLTVGQPPQSLGIDLPPYRQIEPKPGRLVLFPSTMWHGTFPIVAGERLSVAFDVCSAG